jgi:hypothetical protein
MDMACSIPRENLLSHRLRGFDAQESTLLGLKAALERNVAHVEFDVRLARDGTFLAYHDPFVLGANGVLYNIRDFSATEIKQMPGFEKVPTLQEMLECFKKYNQGNTKLHIDVKAAGSEHDIVSLLSDASATENTVIVSWMPSIIEKFSVIAPEIRLCFSHITFFRLPALHKISKIVLNQHTIDFVGKITSAFSPYTGAMIRSVRIYYDQDNLYIHDDEETSIGYNHGHLVPGILQGKISDILSKNKGIVCLPRFCVNSALVKNYHNMGIDVAVFSFKAKSEIEKILVRSKPDILYVDEATLF